ncbi:MAG: prolyl oligopeptidase family serine peptidase [Planctomycetota bacterium]
MRSPTALAAFAFLAAAPVLAQESAYRLPPKEIVDILDAPPTPTVSFSPDDRWMLLVERPAMPSIEDVMRPWIGLAGIRIDPKLHGERRTSFISGLVLREVGKDGERRITLPKNARVATVRWCHDSQKLAFTAAEENGLALFTLDVRDATPKLVTRAVSDVLGSDFQFSSDGGSLYVSAKLGTPAPAAPRVPSGPAAQETSGTSTPLRTYQDLLTDEHDAALFEHYATAQIVRVDLASRQVETVGKPGMFLNYDVSPDGDYLLVVRLKRPFSYVLAYDDFPQTIELWKTDGTLVRTIADVPMGEHIPQEGVRTGPRNVSWQASAPATLVWAEALDGGDPKTKAEQRDKWMALAAPFAGEARELFRLTHRARGLAWLQAPDQAFASEYDRDKRWTRTWLYDLASKSAPVLVDDRSVNDRYKNPGTPVTTTTAWGTRVVLRDGSFIYRTGQGDTKEGARPFFDRFDLATQTTERLWQCADGRYEAALDVVASTTTKKPTILTSSESPNDPPNYQLRDLESGSVTALTQFTDPTPQLRGLHQEIVKYERADGVDLSATLYLPKGHVKGTRLPLVVWAYPQEFNDASTAGQISGSANRFVRMRGASHLLFLTQGYAIFDAATMPVVGDPETMNDTFLDQVVASAQAAIDKAVEMGVADRERVGVGGHSYGAFMTANLLAHCDLFNAGIARSGAYNRTLTPFGFQSERRTLWEAPQSYVALSPFFVAHKINEPMLMIHGEKDSNPGTFPIQSERMYQAIKGNGGTARLVVLPGEDHGYSARESVLHTVAEMVAWFDTYVRRPPQAAGGSIGAAQNASGPSKN